jgi:hypothetical protein
MAEPRVARPWMPGYGVPESLDGAVPWSVAEERFAACRNYLLATVRPDGRPHLMPLWGLWHMDLFCFSTAITSVKSKNLQANSRCVVSNDDGHHCVVIEGIARVTELDEVPGFVQKYDVKYDGDYGSMMGPIWTVKPTVAFAFNEDDTFSTSATRWEF